MHPQLYSITAGSLALGAGGLYYGARFCGLRNYLIGFEWFALGLSSLNFLFYEFTHYYVNYLGLFFLDTFSRAFGLPLTTVAGLMVITHGFRPSLRADVLLFLIPGLVTLFLMSGAFAPYLPYVLLMTWSFFTLFLLYFVYQLFRHGETLHAVLMTIVAVGNQATAMAYDLFKFPGSDTNVVLNFYTIALFLWSYLTVQTYYSYRALARAKGVDGDHPTAWGPGRLSVG